MSFFNCWAIRNSTTTVLPTGWENQDTPGYWFGRNSSGILVITNCNDFDDQNCLIKNLTSATCVTGNYDTTDIAIDTSGATYGCLGTTQGMIFQLK